MFMGGSHEHGRHAARAKPMIATIMKPHTLATCAALAALLLGSSAQAADEAAQRAAQAGRLNEQRAMQAMRDAYGVACPTGFNPVLFSSAVLLCQVDLPVPLALTGCPAERPNYFARVGARDACLRNDFLPEGRLETVAREGSDFSYAEPMADAVDRAQELLARHWGRRMVARPPAGLRDAGRFTGKAIRVPAVPAEHVAIPLTARLTPDALGDNGEDATVVTFRVFTPAVKYRP